MISRSSTSLVVDSIIASIERSAKSLLSAWFELPSGARPEFVFAFKSGHYDNAGIDMGQYEVDKTLRVAFTYENGRIFGWYSFRKMDIKGKSEESDGKDFGALFSIQVSAISSWTSGLFSKFGVPEPNSWAGPSMGRGSYRIDQLIQMLASGEIQELKDEVSSLPWEEKVVLWSFGYKSSYGGISDFRKYEAIRGMGISDSEYETARNNLKRKGFIFSNNALSPKGKEAKEAVGGMNLRKR